MKTISIVIPVYNEEENLLFLHAKMVSVLDATHYAYEIIYVDDGSKDNSFTYLQQLAQQDDKVKVVQFTRNYGQTAAIAAGIDHATGEVVIFLDADLQNDPADIPMMLDRLREGYDVVSGWRKHRQDKWLTRVLPSKLANSLISKVTGVHLHDYGCTLKAYRREVLMGYKLYGEMHRFLPAYAAQVGARIIEVPVQHHSRQRGQSKYGLERTFKVILDLFTVKFLSSYAQKPIYLFGSLGVLLMVMSLLLVGFLIWQKLTYGIHMITSPLLHMAATFVILGVQAIFLGLIGELLVRTYHESQDKPTYSVRNRLNIRRVG